MGYNFRRTVTIDHTKVSNSDQTNFPAVFSGVYAYLATIANGGNVTNTNGYDIIFTSDSAGLTKLDFEIETYDPVTGTVNFWIRIPTLSTSVDTVIYLFYGNPAISTFQGNVAGVWDSDFKAVYHFPNGSTLTANDSTSNANNGILSGTPAPTAAAGVIDGGSFYNGSSAYIQVPASGSISLGNTFTISCWMRPENLAGRVHYFSNRNGSNTGEFDLEVGDAGGAATQALAMATIGHFNFITVDNAITIDVFQYVTYSRNGLGAGSQKVYINGVNITLATDSPVDTNMYSDPNNIGWDPSNNSFYIGYLDEFRISGIQRSLDWTKTEYNNQFSPSTFYSVSAGLPISIMDPRRSSR